MQNLIIIIWAAPITVYMLYWAFWYAFISKENEYHPFELDNDEAELLMLQLAVWPIIIFGIILLIPFIAPFLLIEFIKKKRIKNASSRS